MESDTIVAPADDRFATAVALYREGRDAEALAACEEARERQPDNAGIWQLSGVLLTRLERPAEAADAFARAVALSPDDPALRFQHATVLLLLDRSDAARAALEDLCARAPDHVEGLRALAGLYRRREEFDRAVATWERLLRLAPDDVAAWTALGRCHAARQAYGHAEACLRRAAVLAPDSAAAHIAHARILRSVDDPDAALAAAGRALALEPGSAEAHAVRAAALRDLGRTVEGLAAAGEALRLDPACIDALVQAGLLLHDSGALEPAVAAYREAIRLDPENVDAHWNGGVALLKLGRFEEGFAEYEWRFRSPLFYGAKPRHSQPRWDGAPLDGRRLLVHAEQGLGDTIQFLRYLVPLRAAGASFHLEVPKRLVPLVQENGLAPSLFAASDPLPDFDLRASIVSLPHLLKMWPGDPALPMPYLHAAPQRIGKWAARLDRLPWPRVGLAWRGNPEHRSDAHRSLSLAALRELFAEPVTFVSLQADGGAEIASEELGYTIEDWSAEMDRDGAFLDTAALMMSLDLVVTVDTAIAHLAGALGRPALLLLAKNPDFRWMLGREDTPWYPSLRLLRQERAGDWLVPVAAARKALWRLASDG